MTNANANGVADHIEDMISDTKYVCVTDNNFRWSRTRLPILFSLIGIMEAPIFVACEWIAMECVKISIRFRCVHVFFFISNSFVYVWKMFEAVNIFNEFCKE